MGLRNDFEAQYVAIVSTHATNDSTEHTLSMALMAWS